MTYDIELALAKGKIEGAKKLLQEYFEKEDYNNWLSSKQSEYDSLFPLGKLNKNIVDKRVDSLVNNLPYANVDFGLSDSEDWTTLFENYNIEYEDEVIGITFPDSNTSVELLIDLKEDDSVLLKNYITFNDWINETKSVLVGTETAIDDSNIQYEKEIFEKQLIHVYIKPDVSNLVDSYLNIKYKEQRANEYPPIAEQLDMLYKDMTNGTNNWLETIRQIKDKYPKVEV